MPESKHPVFFVVYVSGAILFLLLMELSRVHDLVIRVLLNTWCQLFQMSHHAVRHRRVELVIARERDDWLREFSRLQLKPRYPHFYAQLLRFF